MAGAGTHELHKHMAGFCPESWGVGVEEMSKESRRKERKEKGFMITQKESNKNLEGKHIWG